MMDRREAIQKGALLAAGALVAGRVEAQEAGGARFFPGFKPFKVKTTGAEINGVIGGSGPPILLLHGAPQSHITWRLVAPKLAASRTDEPTERLPAAATERVVAPDIDVPTVAMPMRSATSDEDLPPTTVLPTAAITEESDDTPPSGTRRPAIIIASGLAAVVVSAVIAIGLLQPTAPAVDYPAVDGDLGIHLEQLQESVDP